MKKLAMIVSFTVAFLASHAAAAADLLAPGILVGDEHVYLTTGDGVVARRVTDGGVGFKSSRMRVPGVPVGRNLFGWGTDGPVLLNAKSGKLVSRVTGHGTVPVNADFRFDPSNGQVNVKVVELQGTGIRGRMNGRRIEMVWSVRDGLELVSKSEEGFVDQAGAGRRAFPTADKPAHDVESSVRAREAPDGWHKCGTAFCQVSSDELGIERLRRKEGDEVREVGVARAKFFRHSFSPEQGLVAVSEKFFEETNERQWRVWSTETLKPVGVIRSAPDWVRRIAVRGRHLLYTVGGAPELFVVVAATGEPVWSESAYEEPRDDAPPYP